MTVVSGQISFWPIRPTTLVRNLNKLWLFVTELCLEYGTEKWESYDKDMNRGKILGRNVII